jgi:hypothetical protein
MLEQNIGSTVYIVGDTSNTNGYDEGTIVVRTTDGIDLSLSLPDGVVLNRYRPVFKNTGSTRFTPRQYVALHVAVYL